MKAIKRTGLVPVEFLKSTGPYQKAQIAGLDPAVVKRFKNAKEPVIKEAAIPEGVETVEIDEDTLQVIPASPALGGYKHLPPLASDRVAGRNRFHEEEVGADFGAQLPDENTSPEDASKGTTGEDGADDKVEDATTPKSAGKLTTKNAKQKDGEPPVPPA